MSLTRIVLADETVVDVQSDISAGLLMQFARYLGPRSQRRVSLNGASACATVEISAAMDIFILFPHMSRLASSEDCCDFL